ncbi:hypothetical protein CEXT_441181 [Caerostris extrusa]|uniref:Uncharacterized protein n=1 Tax=Caerostris extrusa TaxID=172846 RepID=A0AAV4XGM0_CAEEX|nr:hypothetical protein CEXT_441181 [Caerostris extrusa]
MQRKDSALSKPQALLYIKECILCKFSHGMCHVPATSLSSFSIHEKKKEQITLSSRKFSPDVDAAVTLRNIGHGDFHMYAVHTNQRRYVRMPKKKAKKAPKNKKLGACLVIWVAKEEVQIISCA